MTKNNSQLIIYQTESGETKIDVRLENETVWLTQRLMAELFDTSVPNINIHLKNCYEDGEIEGKATIKDFLIVRKEGHREVSRKVDFYNSEKRFYRKITDIYALSIDYDPTNPMSIEFFQTVQNKVHFAITGRTAAEIISERVDSKKLNMGLTCWRGEKVRKDDTIIAKNYLHEEELLTLNNLIEQYLIFAEGQAMQRIPMKMKDWIKKLEGFLTLNNRDILQDKGKISHKQAKQLAEKNYGEFNQKRAREYDQIDADFDNAIKLIESQKKIAKTSNKV